ncbi:hypothetical protein GCM10010172_07900 [Paractinoplanes ferrugineus]|uniref:Uncharacterized protein n=1 Tax=Paractinoplanes ferrugineus TaxID=113564 RepID=A0A919J774_9ACTN|nr:hypothetical protein [Actinoplanes ferrugineus]GIE15323.1 hypothetical protein Afe05nite_71630 [Actinoplanes ferrugineus]
MSNELKRAFDALSDDAGRGRLETAATVRRRSDRRRAGTAVAGTLAVAVVVAGVVAGSRLLLAGPSGPAPQPAPADSGSTTVVPAPSVAGVTTPPVTTPPVTNAPAGPAVAIPAAIPASAFLQPTDTPGRIKEAPRRLGPGAQPLPDFCADSYDQRAKIGIRATQVLYFTAADSAPGSTPKAGVYEEILVFRGSVAEVFMRSLRDSVRGCPVAGPARNYLRDSLGLGDESVLIERTAPATGDDGEPAADGSLHHLYWAVIRVGDSVAFVSNTGWESISADRADTEHLAARAAARLAAWRG